MNSCGALHWLIFSTWSRLVILLSFDKYNISITLLSQMAKNGLCSKKVWFLWSHKVHHDLSCYMLSSVASAHCTQYLSNCAVCDVVTIVTGDVKQDQTIETRIETRPNLEYWGQNFGSETSLAKISFQRPKFQPGGRSQNFSLETRTLKTRPKVWS